MKQSNLNDFINKKTPNYDVTPSMLHEQKYFKMSSDTFLYIYIQLTTP